MSPLGTNYCIVFFTYLLCYTNSWHSTWQNCWLNWMMLRCEKDDLHSDPMWLISGQSKLDTMEMVIVYQSCKIATRLINLTLHFDWPFLSYCTLTYMEMQWQTHLHHQHQKPKDIYTFNNGIIYLGHVFQVTIPVGQWASCSAISSSTCSNHFTACIKIIVQLCWNIKINVYYIYFRSCIGPLLNKIHVAAYTSTKIPFT